MCSTPRYVATTAPQLRDRSPISFLYPLLGRFRRDYPGIEIGLHAGDPEHSIARVVAGEEQLAIAAKPDRLPRGALFRPLAISPLVFVGPRDADTANLPPRARRTLRAGRPRR